MTPTIFGKNIEVRGDTETVPPAEFAAMFRGLNVREGLRDLGLLFSRLEAEAGHPVALGDTAVSSFVVPYLALMMILESSDAAEGRLTESKLAELARSFHALPDQTAPGEDIQEFLFRQGRAQLTFQHADPLRFGRLAHLYTEVWQARQKSSALDLDAAAAKAFGVGVEQALLLGAFFWLQARQGFVHPLAPSAGTTQLPALDEQRTFLATLTATYDDIRTRARANPPPNEALAKYRFNPLVLLPLVRPDDPWTHEGLGELMLVPCRRFLLDRITYGLNYDFRQEYRQTFNEALGDVFEAYVGELLRAAYGAQSVRGNLPNRVKKKKIKSPDWMVHHEGRGVLFEVKKTLLKPSTRSFARGSEMEEDSKRVLYKAVRQLGEYRRHLRSFPDMPRSSNLEQVIVELDHTHMANAILLRRKAAPQGASRTHVVTVSELEMLVANRETVDSLYESLWSKRHADGELAEADLHDWMARTSGALRPNPYLQGLNRRFFERWGLETDAG